MDAHGDAAEVLLFDGPDCTGEVRMLDRSVADFRQIGFDNRVSSIVVLSGVWQFFRDAGYRQIRGPAFVHSGFSSGNGTQPPCVAVQAASDGRFPGNLM